MECRSAATSPRLDAGGWVMVAVIIDPLCACLRGPPYSLASLKQSVLAKGQHASGNVYYRLRVRRLADDAVGPRREAHRKPSLDPATPRQQPDPEQTADRWGQ